MGSFHQLTVRQKTICKQHNVIGYHKWLPTAEVVAARCTETSVDGKHYYRNMRINKQLLCTLVQHKLETLTRKYQKIILNGKIYL